MRDEQITFEYERLISTDEVRDQIRRCEGRHVQQAIFSTFMDALTQVCFTERKVRSTIEWEGNRSWVPAPTRIEEAIQPQCPRCGRGPG